MNDILKETIKNFPQFSQKMIFDLISEFEELSFEEKTGIKKIKILDFSGNKKISLFEKIKPEEKGILLISRKEDKVLFEYRGYHNEQNRRKKNYNESIELFNDEKEWDYWFDFELSEEVEKSRLKFEFNYYFFAYKNELKFLLLDLVMNFISKSSKVAADFIKTMEEIKKYNFFLEIPVFMDFTEKELFEYNDLYSMFCSIKGCKENEIIKQLPLPLIPAITFNELPKEFEFILLDILEKKEEYLSSFAKTALPISNYQTLIYNYFEVNAFNSKWKLNMDHKADKIEKEKAAEFRQIFSELLNLSFDLKIENIIEKVEKMQSIEEIKEFLKQLKEKTKL